MLSAEEIEMIDREMGTLRFIWKMMLLSLLLYWYVGLHSGDNIDPSNVLEFLDSLRVVLYILAVIILITTMIVKKNGLLKPIQNQSTRSPGKSAPRILPLLLGKYAGTMILVLAMSESIGIFGLVLAFLGQNKTDLYLLLLISAAAMVLHRPKKGEIIDLVDRVIIQR